MGPNLHHQLDGPRRPWSIAPRASRVSEASFGQKLDEILVNNVPESGIPFEPLIEELERALILKASYATKWNQSRTAELLNLKRDKLRYRMKLYQLGPDSPRDQAA